MSIMVVLLSLVARADDFDRYYSGHIVSASKEVSVRYREGGVRTFDVQNVYKGTIYNDPYSKNVSLEVPAAGSTCSKLIGELASDYNFVIKTDENELVTLSLKASSRESRVRIAGDCDGKISGRFSLYIDSDQLTPFLKVVMSQEPAGAPASDARYGGAVLKVSEKISVRSEDGTVRELDSSGLISGGIYNDLKSIILSSDGVTAKCGDSLGELATDFTVTIRTKKGMVRTATIRAAAVGASRANQVLVFGACNGNSLTQLQLDAHDEASFEIQ